MRFIFSAVFLLFLSAGTNAIAQETAPAATDCAAGDHACLFTVLDNEIAKIDNQSWRDQSFREQAKLLTLSGKADQALTVIDKIETPDTKAMAIRGIGMAAAEIGMTPEEYKTLFTALRVKADTIEHPPSYGIALTYIAMAQAFAGDDAGAMATTKDMTNNALRDKAFGETAEIQAERGNLAAALESIAAIDTTSFRDKAYMLVSKIFADREMYEESLTTAKNIENAYQRSQALLYNLTKQIKPEEVSIK